MPPRNARLQRGRPLARNGALARHTPISARRTRPRLVVIGVSDGIGEDIARELVSLRSGGWCEMRVPGYCFGRAANWCHRVAKGQGGLWQASNGLHGCGSGTTGCHGWCHSNPAAARERGWMLLSTEDPAAAPVRLYDGRRVWLDDRGLYVPVRGAA
jgi:hypothetical protein